jgi:hypothetical protein
VIVRSSLLRRTLPPGISIEERGRARHSASAATRWQRALLNPG